MDGTRQYLYSVVSMKGTEVDGIYIVKTTFTFTKIPVIHTTVSKPVPATQSAFWSQKYQIFYKRHPKAVILFFTCLSDEGTG